MRHNRIIWRAALAVALVAAIAVSACKGPSPVQVEADRQTYAAIAPEYLRYVDADEQLNQEQRDRRHRTVETWDQRIKAAEAQGK